MSTNRRVVDIWWDVARSEMLDADHNPISARERSTAWPFLIYTEEFVLLRIRLLQYNPKTNVYDPYEGFVDPTAEYIFAVDSDWNPSDSPMVVSLDAEINVSGDWEDGTTADPSQGEFSVRVNTNTIEFGDAIENKRSLSAYMEIKSSDNLGKVHGIINPISVTCRNSIYPNGNPPENVQSNFYTRQASDARYIQGQTYLFEVPAGVDSVLVGELGLTTAPVAVLASLQPPVPGGGMVLAQVPISSMSTDGWLVELSGLVPASGYVLVCIPLFSYANESEES